MKPAGFRYYRARSLPEALDLLSGPAANGKLLAGGQSLIPLINLRLSRPEALVDLNPITELAYIHSEDKEIVIGALTRQRALEYSPLIAKELPVLAEAIPQIGHPAIRNRGTLGGSLAHADPAAELPCVLTALDAALVSAGPDGERTIPAEDFFVGYYATALSEREILKEVRIPPAKRPAGYSFLEFARRHGDFALAEAAALIFGENGDVSARVVVGGSVERPLRVASVEKLLGQELSRNGEPGEDLLKEIQHLALLDVQNSGLARDDSEYLPHLTGVLTRRAVAAAAQRWRKA